MSAAVSDTPKTDAFEALVNRPMNWWDFARELERENADLRDTLDAVIAANERGVELWRAAHPGNELVIPDRAKLVGWLLEQNATLRAELGWKTKRIKLLSDSLHDIEGVLKKAATSIFLDAFEAEPKEAQP